MITKESVRAAAAGRRASRQAGRFIALIGFAGQDIENADFYPEDDRFLVERDLTARHHEVAGSEQSGTVPPPAE